MYHRKQRKNQVKNDNHVQLNNTKRRHFYYLAHDVSMIKSIFRHDSQFGHRKTNEKAIEFEGNFFRQI